MFGIVKIFVILYFKAVVLLGMFLLPAAFAIQFWSDHSVPKEEKKITYSEPDFVYYERKGWYPGNHMMQCASQEKCKVWQSEATKGRYQTRYGMIYKCRGRMYRDFEISSYDTCVKSVAGKVNYQCKIWEPFCISPKTGILVWNTHFDPENPSLLVDPLKPIPEKNILDEEALYEEMLNSNTVLKNAKWRGYKRVTAGIIWRNF